MAEAASMQTCCNAGQPVNAMYEPKGHFQHIGDLETYVSKPDGSKAAIILIYDIFGFGQRKGGTDVQHPQVLQVADRLAGAGFTVVVPDLFRGQPWSMECMPPKPEDDLQGWLAGAASWEQLEGAVRATVTYLKEQLGAEKVGIVGFCWGRQIALHAAAAGLVDAAGSVHPSFFGRDAELAAAVNVPIILVSAKGDPLETVKEVLDTKDFGSQCVYKRFEDQSHGFCAARGDWSKPEIASAAGQAIDLLAQFFKKQLL